MKCFTLKHDTGCILGHCVNYTLQYAFQSLLGHRVYRQLQQHVREGSLLP